MKKINTFLLLPILFLALAACANHNKLSRSSTTKQAPLEYLQMERTACFGQCPVYSIELYKDGRIIYTGKRYIADSGRYEKNIGKAVVAKIFKQFDAYQADTCKSSYELMIQDLPGISYQYSRNDEMKTIQNAHFGPGYLRHLANDIDSLGYYPSHKTWKKIQ